MDAPSFDAVSQQLIVKSGTRQLAAFDLAMGVELVLGRSPEADCPVPDEAYLSRRHVVLRAGRGVLEVERVPAAANPVVFNGQVVDACTVRPGEFFVIGSTEFHFHSGETARDQSDKASLSPSTGMGRPGARARFHDAPPAHEQTLSVREMRELGPAGDRMRLLDLLELPVVLRTRSRSEFFAYACGSLRMATGANWVQTVWMGETEPIVLAEDASLDRPGAKRLSRRLMQAAIAEAPKPVTYAWEQGASDASIDATAHQDVNWAICCAMPVPGEAPVLFYVAGQRASRDAARLVGLVADMIGRAIAMEKLERWKSRLGQFFSEKVVSEILESDTEDALAPRITEATVMFFDIRGFSAKTEERFSLREEEDLERILDFTKARRSVLNVVSQSVIDHLGVIISYAGDGLLACWNVPKPIDNDAERACLAAIEMTEKIKELPGGWRCGIGVGRGQIVAGSLGADQKEQYDILGAVVNQSSRIEGITKVVGVPILVTDAVATAVHAERVLTRRVARFRPAGMNEEVDLYTVERTPADAQQRVALEERFAVHARGLEVFEKGAWEEAFKLLAPISTEDAAAKYLLSKAVGGEPPRDWRGVIELTSK